MKYIINSNNLDSYSRNIESGVETNGIKSNDFDSYLDFINALYDGDCDFIFVWED